MELRLEQVKAALLCIDKRHYSYSRLHFTEGCMVTTNGVVMLVQEVANDIGRDFSIEYHEFDGVKTEVVTLDGDGMLNGRVKTVLTALRLTPNWGKIIPAKLGDAEPADYDDTLLNTIGKISKLLTGNRHFKLHPRGENPGIVMFPNYPEAFVVIGSMRLDRARDMGYEYKPPKPIKQ